VARLRRSAVIVAATLAACTAGCETLGPHSCDTSLAANPYVSYTEGTVAAGVYMSSPWNGPLLLFDGGTHYKLYHGLNGMPRSVVSYLSFNEQGTGPLDGGNNPLGGGGGSDGSGGSSASPQGLAQAAGNEVVILGIDCCTIEVANDSCASSWLLVTASGADAASCAGQLPCPLP
jgi:hypothetical protein